MRVTTSQEKNVWSVLQTLERDPAYALARTALVLGVCIAPIGSLFVGAMGEESRELLPFSKDP